MSIDFIHNLATPGGIISFDGEIKDINDSLLYDSYADSKLQIMNYCIFDLMVDSTKHDALVDILLHKKVIKNQSILVRTFDGKIIERNFNLSLISEESKLVFYQNYGSFGSQFSQIDYSGRLLKDIKKLYPFLNKAGKEVFNQIIEAHQNIVDRSTQHGQIENVTKKVASHFPKLTPSEKYFCALISLGFTSKEMEHLSGFTPSTIRVNIHRTCQKYNMADREELFTKLKQTVTET